MRAIADFALRVILATLAGMVAAVGIACDTGPAGDESPEPFSLRDSSGVTIVENHRSFDIAEAWTVDSAPVGVIGAEPGPETELYGVTGAFRLSDGRIVVGLGGEHEIRVYEPDGRVAWRYGREGDGPGEFRGITPIRMAGDSIGIWDFLAARLTVLAPAGDGVSFTRFPPSGFQPTPEIAGPTADGTFLVQGWTPSQDAMAHVFALYDREGRHLGPIETRVPPEAVQRQGGAYMPLQFAASPVFAASTDGFWIGAADREEARKYDPAGRLVRIVRWPTEDRRVTDEDIEQWKEGRGGMELVFPGERIRMDVEDFAFADSFPAYDQLRIDRAGRLWIRRYPRPPESRLPPTGLRTWMVFDSDGRLIARAAVPAFVHVEEIGEDWILVTRLDLETGLERVEVLALSGNGR